MTSPVGCLPAWMLRRQAAFRCHDGVLATQRSNADATHSCLQGASCRLGRPSTWRMLTRVASVSSGRDRSSEIEHGADERC
jgi:hypothetical protein